MKRAIFLMLPISLSLFPSLWAQSLQAERLFLATERETCVPGDTLWIKGQVQPANDREAAPYSRYVYLECIDDRDSLLLRQKVTCRDDGVFYAGLPTQLEWTSRLCYVRAYTKLMQNYAPESLTVVPFLLGTAHPPKSEVAREVYAVIYPESGSLLEGFRQNLVFHLTDDDGFPVVPTEVRLLEADHDTVIHRIAVSDNGLGKFVFQPASGRQYRLQVEYDGRFFHFPVDAAASGTALQAIRNRNRLACRLFSSEEQPSHLFLYHAETGLKEIPLQAGQTSVVVDLAGQPAGVCTLFLTGPDYQLLNERSVWLPPAAPSPDFGCRLPQSVYAPKAPLNYECPVPDSSFVVARVVPQDDLMATQAYPALWLGNELTSSVRFPLMDSRDWEAQVAEIDNWLFTARFAPFSVEETVKEGITLTCLAEDVLLLSGTAREKKERPLKAGTIIGARNVKDQLYYSGITDEQGHFIFPVDDYERGTRFHLSAQDVKGKTVDCTFTLDRDAYPEVVIPHPVFHQTRLQADVQSSDSAMRYSQDENGDKVYHIDDITVQARKRVDMREQSRTPMNFIGEVELQKRASLSIRSILSRFPTIVVGETSGEGGAGQLGASIDRRQRQDGGRVLSDLSSSKGGELGVFWRNMGRYTTLAGGSNKLTVVVDGEIAFGDIGSILDQPAGLVKSIEIIKPSDSRCVPYYATGGLVLIKTVQGLDRKRMEQSSETTAFYPAGGIDRFMEEPHWRPHAPARPGRYLLLIDVVTKDQKVASFCRAFEVVAEAAYPKNR